MKKIMIAALLLAMALLPACGWAEGDNLPGSSTFSEDKEYPLVNSNTTFNQKVTWSAAAGTTPTVTLILKGENTINLTTREARISATGVNVTIKADPADPDASLEIIKEFSGSGADPAFNVSRAKLKIESGNVTVRNETGGEAVLGSQLEVSGGSLTAKTASDSVAVRIYNMTVSGGKVMATSDGSHGIWRTGPLTISGGEVTATGGEGKQAISGSTPKSIELDGVTASHSDDGMSWEAYTGGDVKRYFRSKAVAATAGSAALTADLPQTGDSSALLAWAALLGASCLMLRRRAMN